MGKLKWNTSAKAIDEAESEGPEFEPYDGPVPPNNTVVRAKVKWARVTEFKSGNSGLTLLLEVEEPKSSEKRRFNGYPIFERIVDTDTQAFKINQLMGAIGGTGRHWANTITTKDDRDNEVVTKFGNITTDDLYVRVMLQRETYEGEPRCRVGRWLKRRDESEVTPADDSAADDGDDSGDAPF